MIEPEVPQFGRNHNQPPGLLPLEPAIGSLVEWMNETTQPGGKTFAERKAELLRSAKNAVVRSRETAGQAADVIKIAREVWEKIEAGRIDRSNEYRRVADALKGSAEAFWEDVADAMQGLRTKIDAWTRDEDDRILQQQVEQEQMLADMKREAGLPIEEEKAQQEVPDLPPLAPLDSYIDAGNRHGERKVADSKPIRGDYGGRVSRGQVTEYEIFDYEKIPLHILKSPVVTAAILKFVKDTQKHMGVPDGVRALTSKITRIS